MDINIYKQALLDQQKEKTKFCWKILPQGARKFFST
jgi:hypothetical protein